MKVVKSMCTADMIVQRATVKSHAFQGHVERGVRIIENPCILVLFDVQEMMRVEVDPTSAASAWILSRSVCFLNRYQQHEGGATSFERRFGSPCRSPIFLLFAMVECLVPSDRKTWWSSCGCEGSTANVQVNVWVGRAEECDEHLVVNEIGDVVRVRAVRRCVDNENSGLDIVKLTATPPYLKVDDDDVGVQGRWTPTDGCTACGTWKQTSCAM